MEIEKRNLQKKIKGCKTIDDVIKSIKLEWGCMARSEHSARFINHLNPGMECEIIITSFLGMFKRAKVSKICNDY